MSKKRKAVISAIIIARNEEEKIRDCIKSLDWVNEIIVVDSGSEDKTRQLSRRLGARVYETKKVGYSAWRNEGARKAHGDWVFYVDADERVPKELMKEILMVTKKKDFSAYAIPRKNIILGKLMIHGGWWPDYVKRLFLKSKFKKWTGKLHEEPQFEGNMGHLENAFLHIKHDNLFDMIEKTNKWSEIEAQLLYDSHHPKMTWWRFFRIMSSEFCYRAFAKKGVLDGVEGVIYAIYQSWSKFVTYAKLWEMQLESEKSKVKTQKFWENIY